jgi:hypothetical protein
MSYFAYKQKKSQLFLLWSKINPGAAASRKRARRQEGIGGLCYLFMLA